jgi:hypothetical protein
MASLNPQTYVNPTESYFLLASSTSYNSPADFRNPDTGSSANIVVGDVISNFQLQDRTDRVVNQITQTEGETIFYVGTTTNPTLQILPAAMFVNGSISVTDAPYSNMYFDITSGDNINPTFLYNHASEVPGGVDSAITFTRNGFVTTTDTLQVGSSAVASVNVGPLTGNRVAAGPNRFAFANGATPTGGMYQVGSTVILGQGADPGVAGAGVTVGATTVGFRKSIEAQPNGISINTFGAIRSVSSANNVGGLVQVANGNFYVNLQATGDGFAPNGVGGSLTAFNAGTNTGAPLTLNTGVNSSIVGTSDGLMNILATNTINIAVPGNNLGSTVNITSASTNINSTVSLSLNATSTGGDISINADDTINLNATGSGADITLTANDAINLVAPRVLINGSPSTSLTFFYQWNGAEQAINGSPTLGDGSFLGWDTTLYQTPGYGSRFNAPDTSTWICPVAGVYLVTVNLLCNLQNAINGMSVDLLKLSGGVTSRVGCQMRPAGYKATTAPPSPADLPFYQTQAGALVGTFYTQLAVNDGLRLNGGTFSPGGFLYVQAMSTWSLQYVAAQ